MSINDLLNNGIEIQGRVIVSRFVNDKEQILFESGGVVWNQSREWMDADIKYMYTTQTGLPTLKIEVE